MSLNIMILKEQGDCHSLGSIIYYTLDIEKVGPDD